jgi:hypothetical protein
MLDAVFAKTLASALLSGFPSINLMSRAGAQQQHARIFSELNKGL